MSSRFILDNDYYNIGDIDVCDCDSIGDIIDDVTIVDDGLSCFVVLIMCLDPALVFVFYCCCN